MHPSSFSLFLEELLSDRDVVPLKKFTATIFICRSFTPLSSFTPTAVRFPLAEFRPQP